MEVGTFKDNEVCVCVWLDGSSALTSSMHIVYYL